MFEIGGVRPRAEVASSRPRGSRVTLWLLVAIFLLYNTVLVPAALPSVHLFGPADLWPQDLLVVLACLSGLWWRFSHPDTGIVSPVTRYVSILVSVIFVVIVYSLLILRQPYTTTFGIFRYFYGYFLYFPVVWSLSTIRDVRVIVRLWVVLTLLGVLFYLYTFFVGEPAVLSQHEWLYSRVKEAYGGGIQRILSMGTVLFRTIFFVAIVSWVMLDGRKRWLWGGLAALIGVQIVVQFTRGMYITSFVVLLLLPCMIDDRRGRRRLMYVYGAVFFLGVVALAYKASVVSRGGGAGVMAVAKERLVSGLLHPSEDGSLQGRVEGWRYYLGQLRGSRAFLGLGFGKGIVYGDSTYLSFLIKTGVVGLVAFLLLYGQVTFRGWRHWREIDDPALRAIFLGLWISTVRHVVNGITQADFTSPERVPALIVAVAMMEVLIARARRESEQSAVGEGAMSVAGEADDSGDMEAAMDGRLPTNRSSKVGA